jgi:1-hydroxycarotenoid 3,4-desaturase
MSKARRVAVVGGGIGGLTAAGILARSGHEVTLFESNARVGGKAASIEVDGLRFDTGPTVMTMPDTVRQAFEALGASDLMPSLVRIPLQTRYHFPNQQVFECWEDQNKAMSSAATFGEREAAGLQSFFDEAQSIYLAAGAPYLAAPYESMAGFIARAAKNRLSTLFTGLKLGTLHGLARKHFRSAEMQQFVGRFATYTGASPYQGSAAFAMIAHIERQFGVHHVLGGIASLTVALESAARRQGVDLRLNTKVNWQQTERGYLLVGGDTSALFDAVVVNADPLASIGRQTEALTMSGQVFLFAVKKPVSLPHHSILFSSDYRREFEQLMGGEVPQEPTIHVCHPGASDDSMTSASEAGLYVMVNVPPLAPASTPEQWLAHSQRLESFVVKQMQLHLAGFGASNCRLVGQRTPFDLAASGAPRGSIYGFLPHGRLGPFRRPSMRGPTKGLFFAGGGTHPGGGVPMVMLSGTFAAGMTDAYLRGAA